MTAALIILGGTLAGSVGLGIYLARQWNKTNDRAWKQSDKTHELDLNFTKLEGRYNEAMGVIDVLKHDNAALEKALKEAEDSYAELAAETIDDTKSPRTANVLRMALRRLERLRVQVPEAEKTSAAESGEGEGAVHGSDAGAPD